MLGLQELARQCRKIGDAGDAILEKGLSDAAHIVRDETERQAPVGDQVHYPLFTSSTGGKFTPLSKVRRPGYLKKSIVVQKIKTKELSNAAATFHVGPHRGAFYGYFLEWGTRKMKANRFASRAFDYAQDRALEAANTAVRDGLDKVK